MEENKVAIEAITGEVPFVQDLRANDSPSLNVIPRLSNYADLTTWVQVNVDQSQGWNAAQQGDLVWKCVGFYIRDGIASFIAKFQNENGSPADQIVVTHYWPGAPVIPKDVAVTPDYSGRLGVVGFSNGNGDAGFPYSGGMVYTGGQPFTGVGKIWPLCPTHLAEPKFSDCAEGLGWFGGTDHTTVNPIFRLTRKAGIIGTGFTLALHQDGVDLGVRIAFVSQSTGAGWELILLDNKGQILGSSRFA